MKRLIVVADDFGLTESVNEGILKAVREGIVTSVNIMPSGEAIDGTLSLAREAGIKEAGAHLALTETVPVSDPSKVRTLLSGDRRFWKSRASFIPRFLLGLVDPDEIYVELRSQLERVERSGIRVVSLSSHEHLHMLPGILDIFVKLAKEYDIPSVRFPRSERKPPRPKTGYMYRSAILSFFNPDIERKMKAYGLKSPEHFLGFLDSGGITEKNLLQMIGSLRDCTTELVCHPGFLGPEIVDRYRFHLNCEAELYALTSGAVKKRIKDDGIELLSYGAYLSEK